MPSPRPEPAAAAHAAWRFALEPMHRSRHVDSLERGPERLVAVLRERVERTAHGAPEEHRLLRDDCKGAPAHRVQSEQAQIDAVDAHRTGLELDQPE
eukprot:scaffold48809_cov75-Phaeocystis_antarctica.AAC.6